MNNSMQVLSKKASISLLMMVVFFEVVIRLFLQPDPWLLHPTHWYFNQPQRLLIELSMVFVLLIIVKLYLGELLAVARSHVSLLAGTALASALIFGFLEYEQLLSSLGGELSTIMMWLITGFCIGLGQELIYRGMLYTSLLKFLSVNHSRLLTTVLFVVAPLHSIRLWDLYQQDQIMVVGLLIAIYVAVSLFFQWLREKTDSVMVPGVVHGVGNAITWLAVFS